MVKHCVGKTGTTFHWQHGFTLSGGYIETEQAVECELCSYDL